MFGQSGSTLIVFVDRSRLQFYGGRLSSVLSLDIPPAILHDLEVVNKDALYTLVNQWLKQNNLGGNQLFIVLSPTTYFEKQITSQTETEQETEILKFYDTVPFEEMTTKVLSQDGGKRAVAANSEFLEAIRHAFALQGLRVVGVIPAFVLGSLAAKRWLDAEMGAFVLKHLEALRLQNILELSEPGQMPVVVQRETPNSKSNPRLMMMVGVFGVLLLILIVVIFTVR